MRLTKEEDRRVNRFIKKHPYIQNFSTLVRVALWEYLNENFKEKDIDEKPSFLWDYDLSQGEIAEILNGPQKSRLWLVAKILEHAKWDEIWKYLTLEKIRRDIPLLKLLPKTKAHWEYALKRWRKVA